jgi:hypothetical protein
MLDLAIDLTVESRRRSRRSRHLQNRTSPAVSSAGSLKRSQGRQQVVTTVNIGNIRESYGARSSAMEPAPLVSVS